MSTAKIIALVSQKGGSGKTTVAMQLAAGLARQGHKVALFDLDPQQSATRWHQAAPLHCPFPATLAAAESADTAWEKALIKHAKRHHFVILDCPPSIEHPHSLQALDRCHLALIPVVPSPTDLWSTRGIEKLILNRRGQRAKLQGALLPNRVSRTSLAADVIAVMEEFALPLLDANLMQRNAYPQSALRGASVYQLGAAAQAAQQELDQLVTAVIRHLET